MLHNLVWIALGIFIGVAGTLAWCARYTDWTRN